METESIHGGASSRLPSMAEQAAEAAERERLRKIEMEQQAEVELRARSPEQSAGQVIDQIV